MPNASNAATRSAGNFGRLDLVVVTHTPNLTSSMPWSSEHLAPYRYKYGERCRHTDPLDHGP
jgi:hypothetical protein